MFAVKKFFCVIAGISEVNKDIIVSFCEINCYLQLRKFEYVPKGYFFI